MRAICVDCGNKEIAKRHGYRLHSVATHVLTCFLTTSPGDSPSSHTHYSEVLCVLTASNRGRLAASVAGAQGSYLVHEW